MYKKFVGIVVMTLLIATALPVVGTMNVKEIVTSTKLGDNSLNHQNIPRSSFSNNHGGMFIQLPFLSNATPSQWGAPLSDKDYDGGFLAYDDFWGVSEPICDIHWWGPTFNKTNSGPGDPTGMMFNITFYEDDGAGKPGNVVCKYVDITPPSVQIEKPEEKSLYLFNIKLMSLSKNTIIIGRLTITVNIEDPSDVEKIEFYLDNKLMVTVTEAPYEWMWSEPGFGIHTIKTMTYDALGSIAKQEIEVTKLF